MIFIFGPRDFDLFIVLVGIDLLTPRLADAPGREWLNSIASSVMMPANGMRHHRSGQ